MIPVGVVAGSIVSAVAPGAPTSFTATAASSSSINLSWAAPSTNGGAPITSYTLKRGTTTIYTGSGTSFTNTGLSGGTGYSYTVLASNIIGDGPTASASATTPAGVPSAPTVTAVVTGTYPIYDAEGYDIIGYGNSYTMYISNSNNNGSPITNTRVEFSYSEGGSWNSTPGPNPPQQLSQIDNIGQEGIYYRAYHVNAIGNGAPSNAVLI